jgi:drug/metabolite transporter (DMT)-like permease
LSSSPAASRSTRSYGLLGATIFLWAVGPLFVKHFTHFYDVWTQNAVRYIAAVALLFLYAGVGRRSFRVRGVRQWGSLVLVTGANVGMQTAYGAMLYYIYPSVAVLVGQLAVLFAIALSFLLFHDERRVIRSPQFLMGALLALAGVGVVIVGQNPEVLRQLQVTHHQFWIGIGVTVLWAFFSALYMAAIKGAMREIAPFAAFANVSWMTTLCLLGLMFALGHPSDLLRAPIEPFVGLIYTGMLCIGLAHTLYYAAIRDLSVVVVVTLMQLVPVVTCFLSAFWYKDHLSPVQLAGGAAVLGGAWLASVARARKAKFKAQSSEFEV